ncbi:ABC-type glycerol-3-phosphate transport system permease component [Curtobacterium sp. AB7]
MRPPTHRPIVILVLVFRRSIVSGLTSGAVKG